MTGDARYLEWARRIGDAYVEEVLPGNFGVPSTKWDFATHTGEPQLRLRDHGNELIVGLTLLYALEADLKSERAARYAPVVRRMLDQVLASANPDGMLYNQVDAKTLAPRQSRRCRTTGATSTAPSTRSTRSPARRSIATPCERCSPTCRVTRRTSGSRVPTIRDCRSAPSMAMPTPSRARSTS